MSRIDEILLVEVTAESPLMCGKKSLTLPATDPPLLAVSRALRGDARLTLEPVRIPTLVNRD